MFDIFINYALLASTFSFNKVLLHTLPPLFLAGITELTGGILLAIYLYIRGSLSRIFTKENIIHLIPIALCITYGAAILRLYALCNLASFKMCFFSSFDPFISALLCYVIKKQKLSSMQLIGMTIATLGSLPMLLCNTAAGTGFGMSLFSLPVLAAIGTIVINRIGWIFADDLLKAGILTSIEMTAALLLIGGSLSLGTACIYGEAAASYVVIGSYSLIAMLIYVIIINNVVCSSLYTNLVKRYDVTLLSLSEFLTPLFVAFYGWLFLHEQVNWVFFVSAGLVGVGLTIFSGAFTHKHT